MQEPLFSLVFKEVTPYQKFTNSDRGKSEWQEEQISYSLQECLPVETKSIRWKLLVFDFPEMQLFVCNNKYIKPFSS